MKNKIIKRYAIIGAILAIPFFSLLYILEEGMWTGDDGICPYHKYEIQVIPDSPKPICDMVREENYADGEISAGGSTCIDGIYYQTNYNCITNNLGLFSGGNDFFPIISWWIVLMEVYGLLVGGFIGFVISKIRKRIKLKK